MGMNSMNGGNLIGRASERETFLSAVEIEEQAEADREKFLLVACGKDKKLQASLAPLFSIQSGEHFLERRTIGCGRA